MRPRITVETTRTRATAPPAGERFRDALGETASAVLSGVEHAAGLVPGGGALAAAIRSGQTATGGSDAATTGTSAGASSEPGALLDQQANQAMELLEMQQQISMEQRQFQTVSNVMKARHDTAKAVIQNVR